jgi:hypothetical protein
VDENKYDIKLFDIKTKWKDKKKFDVYEQLTSKGIHSSIPSSSSAFTPVSTPLFSSKSSSVSSSTSTYTPIYTPVSIPNYTPPLPTHSALSK